VAGASGKTVVVGGLNGTNLRLMVVDRVVPVG
jgi:hypothetical protein